MSYFETKTRTTGSTFTYLKEDAPQWLHDAVYDIHDGMLPNDWLYSCIESCMETIGKGETEPYYDSILDCMTYDLLQWAIDFSGEVNEAMGEQHFTSLDSAIQFAQTSVVNRVFYKLLQAVEDNPTDEEIAEREADEAQAILECDGDADRDYEDSLD